MLNGLPLTVIGGNGFEDLLIINPPLKMRGGFIISKRTDSMFYRINWHAATRRVLLGTGANSAPAPISGTGMSDLGTFQHDNETEQSTGLNGMQGLADNHVLFHHVQDALYKQGVQDMQSVKIYVNRTRSISIGSGTLTVAVGANSAPLNVTVTPSGSTDKEVVYTSSNTAVATVNSKGVVHGVAAGNAAITAKLKSDATITATRNVTVA